MPRAGGAAREQRLQRFLGKRPRKAFSLLPPKLHKGSVKSVEGIREIEGFLKERRNVS